MNDICWAVFIAPHGGNRKKAQRSHNGWNPPCASRDTKLYHFVFQAGELSRLLVGKFVRIGLPDAEMSASNFVQNKLHQQMLSAGLVMSTRSGDLDPGLVMYLARAEGMLAPQFNEMVNKRAGLLGMSETSSDIRDLLEIESRDTRAAEALALFCYQAKKWIGALAAALGGWTYWFFRRNWGELASGAGAHLR